MSIWYKLSAKEAHSFYRIPKDIAEDDKHVFYGTERSPFDGDGPWPLFAFLHDKEFPDYVVFQIYEIEPEALEYEPFNPLTDPGGYLFLEKKSVANMLELLNEFEATWQVERKDVNSKTIFSLLDASSARSLKLSPPWVKDMRSECYHQQVTPPSKLGTKQIATVLIFSTGKKGSSPARLFFQITQFELDAVNDTEFDPLAHGLARVYLDRKGLQEMIGLLKRQFELLI